MDVLIFSLKLLSDAIKPLTQIEALSTIQKNHVK